jgi:hypothetical protein
MRLAVASLLVRMSVVAVLGALLIVVAIVATVSAVALGVRAEVVAVITATLLAGYVIIRLRISERLRGLGEAPLYICDKCRRRLRGPGNVQSNNTLERAVNRRGPQQGAQEMVRPAALMAVWSAAQLGR